MNKNKPFEQCLGNYTNAYSGDCIICKVADCPNRCAKPIIVASVSLLTVFIVVVVLGMLITFGIIELVGIVGDCLEMLSSAV